MRFSIVTPSFRGSRWLKLCVASVADQGVSLEHIVQDSCSDDGTQEWLPSDPRVKAFIEKDRGMYDAVNRGLDRAGGEILAYINCDEQYLPGALAAVQQHFERHPELDVVFADAVIVGPKGEYICDRRAITPQRWHTAIAGTLSFLTAATFFRRRVWTDLGVRFNTKWRDLGDVDWALQLINGKVRMGVLRYVTTAFTETGANMNLLANAQREKREFLAAAPPWLRRLRPLIIAHFRLRRLLGGCYALRRYSYALYTRDSPEQRRTFRVTLPSSKWVQLTPVQD